MGHPGFINSTPYEGDALLLADEHGATTLTWVVKASFGFDGDVAAEPAPIRLVDEYHGEPGTSELRYPSDAVVGKVATDVLLLGSAYAAGKLVHDVELRVGDLVRSARVFGAREWVRDGDNVTMGAPEPFEELALRYEHAGHDAERNPLGSEGIPRIEDPASLVAGEEDVAEPVGFGPIPPHWEPRRSFAGTFDEAWRSERHPLLPEDFDRRHWNVAPLQGAIAGGEEVTVAGLRQPLAFQLPELSLHVRVTLQGSEPEQLALVLDTVLIDADEGRTELVYRASKRIHHRAHKIERSEIFEDG